MMTSSKPDTSANFQIVLLRFFTSPGSWLAEADVWSVLEGSPWRGLLLFDELFTSLSIAFYGLGIQMSSRASAKLINEACPA